MKTIVRKLKHGMKVGERTFTEFEMRESTTGDMFQAEDLTPASKSLAFSGQMMCLQLIRVGDFKGPFTLAMIGKLSKVDYEILYEAQKELDKLGEE